MSYRLIFVIDVQPLARSFGWAAASAQKSNHSLNILELP
jgi:hypothetical protein